MKRSHLVRLVFLLLAASTLPGCFWRVEEGRSEGGYERERGEHHEERREERREELERR